MDDKYFLSQLSKKLKISSQPIIVPVLIDSNSKVNDCFKNVAHIVEKEGGSVVNGWMVHRNNFFYEGERHAIWKTKNNELIDITPKEINYHLILFFKDKIQNWEYDGSYIDNVRLNITANRVVDDYIKINETISKLIQKGRRNQNGELMVTNKVANTIAALQRWKRDHEVFMYSGGNLKTICYCCNSLPYELCIGAKLENDLNFILERANI